MSPAIARLLGEATVRQPRQRVSLEQATEALILADGTRLLLRPIGREDREGLAALFARLTPESRHRRFLTPKHELTPRKLAFFTDIDHVRHEAIAALDQRDGSIVGVARYAHFGDRARVAELAVLIADDLQRRVSAPRSSAARLRQQLRAYDRHDAAGEPPGACAIATPRFRARASSGTEIEFELELNPTSEHEAARDTKSPCASQRQPRTQPPTTHHHTTHA